MDALQPFLSQRLSSGGMLVISIAVGVCLIYNLRPRRVRPGDSGPPIVPYKIPYLQHLPAFLWNPGKLYREMQARYPGRPFTLWLNNTKFHVFYETSTVNHIFSRSRTFSFDPVMASMMENGIILPPEDLLKFSPPAELEGKERADSRRFITANHNIWSKYLAGKPLEKIMEIYMQNFNAIMGQHLDLQGTQWQTVDFHELVQRMIFETTVLTFFGPRIKKIWGNNMWDDWKLYDQATYIGVRSKLAIILQPRVYLAYRRMMVAFEKWIDSGSTEWPATDGIRNEQWGARMNWERDRLGVECGFSLRGRACLQAGFLWVSATNAAPMSSWFAFCAAQTREILHKYRANAASFILPPADNNELRLDIAGLKRNPFIQGLWKEALRLGTASAAARVVTKDSELGGFTVSRGSILLMPVILMHYDENVFPDSRQVKPERWMSDNEEKIATQNKQLRAFGGGASLCSGRFVAELEVISVVSIMLLRFDVEFDESSKNWEFNPRSVGVMGPTRAPIARLRPRNPYHRTG